MIPIVESALQLSNEIAKIINTEISRKYLDKVFNLKSDILEEEAKGQLCNDAKLERLNDELKIAMNTARDEIISEMNKAK